jgi:hypothetical protein
MCAAKTNQTDKGLGATASMLSSMKSIKMLGISTQLGAAIQKMQLDEIKSATSFRILQIIMITLCLSSPSDVPANLPVRI